MTLLADLILGFEICGRFLPKMFVGLAPFRSPEILRVAYLSKENPSGWLFVKSSIPLSSGVELYFLMNIGC